VPRDREVTDAPASGTLTAGAGARAGAGGRRPGAGVEPRGERWSRLLLATLLGGAGVLHLVFPETYATIIPGWVGHERAAVLLSGGAELAVAVLLAVRRTAAAGGWCAAVLLVAVFPANVEMALDGGAEGAEGLLGSPVVAWLRLPLQVPLVAWAIHHGRRGARRPAATAGAGRR
jgi:uncharacterized membrane protein